MAQGDTLAQEIADMFKDAQKRRGYEPAWERLRRQEIGMQAENED